MGKIELSNNPLDVEHLFGREEELKEIEENIFNIEENIFNNLILLGPRRVGKTTLLNAIKKRNGRKYRIIKYDCETHRKVNSFFAELYTPVKKLKFFVSSVGKKDKGKLREEREWAEKIIKKLGHNAFLIENIVSSHSGENVEEKNIKDSDGFVIILGEGEEGVSEEVKKEYQFAIKYNIPVWCLIKGLNDEGRPSMTMDIIKDIKENQRGIYNRYENLEEFKNVLRNTIVEKEKELQEEAKNRYKNSDFRNIGDLFFNAVGEQKDKKFLILIDEFGELRHDKDLKNNFDDFLAYFRSKIDEKPENCTFILTGSENIFTTTYQKYFGGFKPIEIKKFDINTAKDLIIDQLGWNKQNKVLDKIIEISGTLPKDLVHVIDKLKNKQNLNDNKVKEILKEIIKNPEFEIHKQYPFLDKEEVNFIKNISEILPASKREILSMYNKEEIFDKISKEYFILNERESDGKYEFVSKLMWWRTIYDKGVENFNKIINNILKNGSTIKE